VTEPEHHGPCARHEKPGLRGLAHGTAVRPNQIANELAYICSIGQLRWPYTGHRQRRSAGIGQTCGPYIGDTLGERSEPSQLASVSRHEARISLPSSSQRTGRLASYVLIAEDRTRQNKRSVTSRSAALIRGLGLDAGFKSEHSLARFEKLVGHQSSDSREMRKTCSSPDDAHERRPTSQGRKGAGGVEATG